MHRHIIHIHKPDQNTTCINALFHGCWSTVSKRQQTHEDCPWRHLPNLALHLLTCFYFKEKLYLWLHFTHGSLRPIILCLRGGDCTDWFITVHNKCALFNENWVMEMRCLWSSIIIVLVLDISAPSPAQKAQPQQCIVSLEKPHVKILPSVACEEICGNVWDEIHKHRECKRLQLLEMKIGFL